jgi:hypothetical protein
MSDTVALLIILIIVSCSFVVLVSGTIGYINYIANSDDILQRPTEYESELYAKRIDVGSSIVPTETNQVCKIMSFKKSQTDKQRQEGKSFYLPKPWYANPANPNQCFAPPGQKCCNQVVQGCMQDFTNTDDETMTKWYETCPLSFTNKSDLPSAPLPDQISIRSLLNPSK